MGTLVATGGACYPSVALSHSSSSPCSLRPSHPPRPLPSLLPPVYLRPPAESPSWGLSWGLPAGRTTLPSSDLCLLSLVIRLCCVVARFTSYQAGGGSSAPLPPGCPPSSGCGQVHAVTHGSRSRDHAARRTAHHSTCHPLPSSNHRCPVTLLVIGAHRHGAIGTGHPVAAIQSTLVATNCRLLPVLRGARPEDTEGMRACARLRST